MPAPRQWLWFVGLWAAGVGVTAAGGLRDQVLAEVTGVMTITSSAAAAGN